MRMGSANNARPQVTLTYAQSLDGCIAVRRGESLNISGPESLRMTHQLRAEHDAILVGIGTILADDPQLTVRFVEGPNPQPVVLDSHLRFPMNARLLGNSRKPWIVTVQDTFVTHHASEDRRMMLESKGVQVLSLHSSSDGLVDLPAMLHTLHQSGINRLMVEGGARVITAFLREKLVDEVVLTISPVFIGGLRAIDTILTTSNEFLRLSSVQVESHGRDWVVRGNLRH